MLQGLGDMTSGPVVAIFQQQRVGSTDLSKTLTKEHRNSRRDMMGNSIADIQDQTVLALAEGAKKLSRHAL